MRAEFIWFLGALIVLAAVLAGGRGLLFGSPFEMGAGKKALRGLLGLIAGGALFVMAGAFAFTPEGGGAGETGEEGWATDLDQGFATARAENKPLFVDAWATWCTSCIRLRKETFTNSEVKKKLEGYVTVAIDMDEPRNEPVWDKYAIKGLPWVAVFDPGQTKTPRWFLTDFEPPDKFAKRLESGQPEQDEVAGWLAGKGLLLTLLLVFLGGILASLTPCAYPTYLLVFGFFSGAGQDGPRGAASRLLTALALVSGMAVSYCAAGLLAALGGGAVGRVMTDPWVMGAIAALFVLMGASSLSVLPPMEFSGLKTALHGRSRGTLLWALVFGLVMGLIVAPCVGPLLIGILTYIATAGDVMLGVGLMVTFALGMGVLFFAMALFSQAIRNRLRMGAWNEVITVLFGLVFFAAAFYYLKGVIPYEKLFGLM